MSGSLIKRLKTSIFSPAMLISVFIGIWFLTWSRIANRISYNATYGTSLTFRDIGDIFINDIAISHSLSGYDLFAPILAVLPAATLFCEDYNSGYIKSILSRSEKSRYIRETLLCSSIAGGFAIFLPCFISGLFYLVNGKMNTLDNMSRWGISTSFDETVYAQMQYTWGGLLLALMLMVLAFLFGAVWSDVGLLVSVIFPNKYLALAAPFALYFSVHLIFYRLGTLLVLSPVNMLMPNTSFIPFTLYPLLYEILLLGIICILFSVLVKRRLWNV